MLLNIGMLLAGFVALYLGAEGLVRGASALALRLGITPLIVGLTVVAFGTSTPELLVGLLGTDDIAVGNIVGSNIANILLILGAAAVVSPIKIDAQVVKREVPLMIGATVLFVVLAIDGNLSVTDGAILAFAIGLYLIFMFVEAFKAMKAGTADLPDELEGIDPEKSRAVFDLLLVVGGIVGLIIGAKFMVDGATEIALAMGVSPLVIALSIVALGTSLPELATSIVAAFRGESDIAVGNVVGSNMFNILFVLGALTLVGTVTVGPDVVRVDQWVMLGVTVLIWPMFWFGHKVSRLEGLVLLAIYAGYMVYLFMR